MAAPLAPSPSHSHSHDNNLNTETIHNTRRSLLEWIQLSVPNQRSTTLLPSLPTDTLCWGLKWLRNYISHLVEQDDKLYPEFLDLVPEAEWAARGFAYAGWHWGPPPEETVEKLTKEELLGFLWADVGVYDEVLRNVNFWRREIKRLKRERVAQRMDLKGPVFDGRAKEMRD
ncbi:hypothetical protein BDV96DRAFT_654868 [Lophiotrema nucula]|uniref:Uncharacterized protein n=1 Tax=Lophiotrema nucula TaxID=690887 RepID=A0A6A5YH88_9PLEO|nr:hypothetical protein BDV96DRAFT_654868 [Lophiotrema nucula]